MNPEEWKAVKAKRAETIEKINERRKQSYAPEYYEVEKAITPCCGNCEFHFSSGNCAGGIVGDPEHEYGHKVIDNDDVCLSWGASYDAFSSAFAKRKTAPAAGQGAGSMPR